MNEKLNPDELGGTALAYMGDSVYEVMVRNKLLEKGIRDTGRLNKKALFYVKATAQSEALERILPILDEKETEIFKRGRNAHGISIPKSASANEYRRATGLEALFGWLYLTGNEKRAKELFSLLFEGTDDDKES